MFVGLFVRELGGRRVTHYAAARRHHIPDLAQLHQPPSARLTVRAPKTIIQVPPQSYVSDRLRSLAVT